MKKIIFKTKKSVAIFLCIIMIFAAFGVIFNLAPVLPASAQSEAEITQTTVAKNETINVDNQLYETKYSYLNLLEEYYNDFVEYCDNSVLKIEIISFDEFVENYYSLDGISISEYIDYLCSKVDELIDTESVVFSDYYQESLRNLEGGGMQLNSSSSGGSGDPLYYNTGTEVPTNYTLQYNKFNFSLLTAGDIIHEAAGSGGILGHSALVEGQFYSYNKGMYYWRLVESISMGVSRSIMDDQRFIDKRAWVLSPSATTSQRQSAIYFCLQQLGKDWVAQPFTRPTDINHHQWMCSTMVWAGYKYANIDLVPGTIGGIFPQDLFYSSKLTKKSINPKNTVVFHESGDNKKITDDADVFDSFRYTGLTGSTNKTKGYTTVMYIISVDVQEIHDGYQHVFLDGGYNTTRLGSKTDIGFGLIGRNKDWKTHTFVVFASINTVVSAGDYVRLGYGASGTLDDDWNRGVSKVVIEYLQDFQASQIMLDMQNGYNPY